MAEIQWQKVLCPVDFSEESRAALRVALDLCKRFGAALTLFHVRSEAQRLGPQPTHPEETVTFADLQQLARTAGLSDVTTAEEAGDPRQVILDYARRGGFDLIVMGTHGRTGRDRALAGSVAEGTVRAARCPVLVVHPDWKQAKG